MGWLDNVLGIGGLIADVGGALLGSSSAHEANRANIKLAREQRAWEADMANTAVRRRKEDLIAAGFNPVLAATSPGAVTPSVATPSVEPTFRPEWTKGAGVSTAMALEQMRAIRINNTKTAADAQLTTQQARIMKVEADAKERYGADMADWDYQKSELSLKEAKQKLENMILEGAQTAAQTERLRRTMESLVKMAEQQARAEEIDLEALENFAKLGGVEASKASGVVRTLKDIIIQFMRGNK